MKAGDTQNYSKLNYRNNFSIISFFFLLICLLSLIIFSFLWSNHKRVKSYHLSNLKYYSSKSIDSVIAGIVETNSDFSLVLKELEKFSFFKHLKIYRKNADAIIFEFEEKEPLLLVSNGANLFGLITIDFDIVSHRLLKSYDYPILIVETFDEREFLQKYFNILRFFQNLKQYSPSVFNIVQEIRCQFPNLCLITKSTKTKIIVPSNPDIKQVLVLNELINCKNFTSLQKKEIDLRYDGLIVLR